MNIYSELLYTLYSLDIDCYARTNRDLLSLTSQVNLRVRAVHAPNFTELQLKRPDHSILHRVALGEYPNATTEAVFC